MISNHRRYHVCNLRGSNNLHSLHILAMPPDKLKKGSLPLIANTLLWFSFLSLFIATIMSVITASLWCSFLCVCYITNHFCFIIVVSPTVAMFSLQGLYIVNIDVKVLFLPRIVMKVHHPISDRSCPFCRTTEEILLKMNIVVPPGLQSEFHLIFDSDVQKLNLFFGQASFSVCLNCWYTWALSQWTLLSVRQTISTPFSLSVKHNWRSECPPLPSSSPLMFM